MGSIRRSLSRSFGLRCDVFHQHRPVGQVDQSIVTAFNRRLAITIAHLVNSQRAIFQTLVFNRRFDGRIEFTVLNPTEFKVGPDKPFSDDEICQPRNVFHQRRNAAFFGRAVFGRGATVAQPGLLHERGWGDAKRKT